MATVLYVEDVDDLREVIAVTMRLQGLEVVEFSSPFEALRALEERWVRPAVIVMDLMLPGMTGLELRRRLLADPELAAIPCVAYSAYPGLQKEAEALRMSFFEKPDQLDQVVAFIKACAERYQ